MRTVLTDKKFTSGNIYIDLTDKKFTSGMRTVSADKKFTSGNDYVIKKIVLKLIKNNSP